MNRIDFSISYALDHQIVGTQQARPFDMFGTGVFRRQQPNPSAGQILVE
jgi:hypothetical protein